MKTHLIKMIACGLLIGIASSCKDKDTSTEATDTQTTVTDKSSTGNTSNMNTDATTGTNTDANAGTSTPTVSESTSGDGSSGRTASTSVNRSKAIQTGARGKKDNRKGYSAPNGTDAENHDGDQYTKNDTTRMPSGPPIK